MFKDGAATTYDATNAKFVTNTFGYSDSVAGTQNPLGAFEQFNYVSLAGFAQKVDNSVAGEMRDCGECHVGGGMMEYVNTTRTGYSTPQVYDPAQRTSLRDVVWGSAVTAFNTFIDIFGPTGDARTGTPTFAAVNNDYAQTGVLEMDCLMCHQNDYDWAKRKEAIRKGEFDASRAFGAGFAKSIASGTQVFYNSTSVKKNAVGELTVNLSNLSAMPSANNCASCHMGTEKEKYQVEWKKRGEMWTAGNEVHMGIGCMGCHERNDIASITNKSAATVGTSGLVTDAKLGLCDPAKGKSSPFEALWNQVDSKQFKECGDCHSSVTKVGSSSTYGAPNMEAIHAVFGLSSSAKGGKIAFTYKIAADGSAGIVRGSHLDIIDCTACHIKKSGFSGGAFVDGTGADAEGRVALHDTENVARNQNDDSIAPHWLTDPVTNNRKIYASNLLTSFFWRDMNGMKTANGGFDANNDGREAGMDPFLPAQIAKINKAAGRTALTEYVTRNPDGSVLTGIDKAIIAGGQAAIKTYIKAELGTVGTPVILPKISALMVPFKASHNIAPASKAWGAKGCKECHAANAGFYNGSYPLNGNLDGKFTFDSNQVAVFTKVNGTVDTSDTHPNVMDKKNVRSVPVQVLSKFDGPNVATTTALQSYRNIDRSEMLYETNFQTRDTTWYDSTTPITGGGIVAACVTDGIKGFSPFYCADPDGAYATAGGDTNYVNGGNAATPNAKSTATSTIGWFLKIETTSDNGVTVVTRSKQIANDMTSSVDDGTVNSIISGLGAGFCNNAAFEFTITSNTAKDALVITANSGFKIRLSPQSDLGPLGLKGKVWKADPIVRTGVTDMATRVAYVAYLDSIGAAPVAQISTVATVDVTGEIGDTNIKPIAIAQNVATDFVAASAGAGSFSYAWYATGVTGSGQTAGLVFPNTGTYLVTLTTTNTLTNQAVTNSQYVKVSAPGPTALTTGSIVGVLPSRVGTGTLSGMPAHTRIFITWGDGGTNNYTTSTATFNMSHTYYGATAGKNFSTIVKVMNNAGAVLDQITIPVTFPGTVH